MTSPPSSAQSFEALAAELSLTDQDLLRDGQVVVSGDAGEYVARVMVNASSPIVWNVLTDYEHFNEFLPSVSAAEVLETDENRTVVEQTNNTKVLLADIESTLRTENIEIGQRRVEFTMTEGDLEEFRGYWQITPVSGAGAGEQTLIKQLVIAEADLGLLDGTFYNMFKGALKKSLEAIQVEIDRRQQQSS